MPNPGDHWPFSSNHDDGFRKHLLVPNTLEEKKKKTSAPGSNSRTISYIIVAVLALGLAAYFFFRFSSVSPIDPDKPDKPNQDQGPNIKGFNVDLTTDTVFNEAVRWCDYQDYFGNYPNAKAGLALMHSVFENKLSVVATLLNFSLGNQSMLAEFVTIKTFYTLFSSIKGKCQVNVIEEINHFNQKHNLSLRSAAAIYLFVNGRDGCVSEAQCNQWVEAQLTAFQDAVIKHPSVVNAVVIGNGWLIAPGL